MWRQILKVKRFLRFRLIWKIGAGIVVLLLLLLFFRCDAVSTTSASTVYEVRRGTLPITIVEGGSAASLEPNRIKCEVKGASKIIKIVEEGYQVTKEDVENEKVLVELDSSEIEKQMLNQEIQYQNTKAAQAKAEQDYEIQEEQNRSDIEAAERDVNFKAMDLKKYLGEEVAGELIAIIQEQRGVEIAAKKTKDALAAQELIAVEFAEKSKAYEDAKTQLDSKKSDTVMAEPAAAPDMAEGDAPVPAVNSEISQKEKENGEQLKVLEQAAKEAEADLAAAQSATREAFEEFKVVAQAGGYSIPDSLEKMSEYEGEFAAINFVQYAKDLRLGGEAEQKRNNLESDIMLEEEEKITAGKQLTGTEKLFEHEFVTEMDLDRDRMALKRRDINVQSKTTSRDLFLQYEFPKNVEELLAKYEEALRKLDRTNREAVTKLTNAGVARDSARAAFKIQEKQRQDYQTQMEKCNIKAKYEGMVVYGDGRNRRWEEPLREGSMVREQQTILTIPDITQMCIKVQVHESAIKKVQADQKATIRIEAYPEEQLQGMVTKVGVLPSSEDMWMNSDLKLYEVTVAIDGTYQWLKPGMTAEVEIAIGELTDVLYVPLQAVSNMNGKRVCYRANGTPLPVETGEMNDKYIVITSGLEEGDSILLRPLESATEHEKSEDNEKQEKAPSSKEAA